MKVRIVAMLLLFGFGIWVVFSLSVFSIVAAVSSLSEAVENLPAIGRGILIMLSGVAILGILHEGVIVAAAKASAEGRQSKTLSFVEVLNAICYLILMFFIALTAYTGFSRLWREDWRWGMVVVAAAVFPTYFYIIKNDLREKIKAK